MKCAPTGATNLRPSLIHPGGGCKFRTIVKVAGRKGATQTPKIARGLPSRGYWVVSEREGGEALTKPQSGPDPPATDWAGWQAAGQLTAVPWTNSPFNRPSARRAASIKNKGVRLLVPGQGRH